MRIVLRNTRSYAVTVIADMSQWIAQHPGSRMRRWSLDDVTLVTLKRYLGLCLNTGLLRKENVQDYLSKKNMLQLTPFFAADMPLRQFVMMQRYLHIGAMDMPARGQPGFEH